MHDHHIVTLLVLKAFSVAMVTVSPFHEITGLIQQLDDEVRTVNKF